jgi:carbon storage regulator
MLVIRRKAGQSVLIGDGVEIEILEAGPGKVKLGITAPREILVLRKEIRFTREENLMAAQGVTPETVLSLVERIRAGTNEPGGESIPRNAGGGVDRPCNG